MYLQLLDKITDELFGPDYIIQWITIHKSLILRGYDQNTEILDKYFNTDIKYRDHTSHMLNCDIELVHYIFS